MNNYLSDKEEYTKEYQEEYLSEEQEALEYEQRRMERARRRAEMKRRKQKQMRIRRIVRIAVPCVAVLLLAVLLKGLFGDKKQEDSPEQEISSKEQSISVTGDDLQQTQIPEIPSGEEIATEETTTPLYSAHETDATTDVPEDVVSSYAILVDTRTGDILAQRNAKTTINPASMTKVLTVLVAAEHITEEELDDTVTITQDIIDYSFSNDCSNVGFEVDEKVPVRDLFYGTILPSGADAALALAHYVAGSQEAFVELMNQKLEEMGLSGSAHFTNCVGLYDSNHYCSVYDMAMIMQAATDNELCREVLSTHFYITSPTEEHPEGMELSNWFLRRIEDKDAGGLVLTGKTGYVVESGSCAVSAALDYQDNLYICATGNSSSSWRCIYDHVDIYKRFLPQNASAQKPESE